MRIQETFGGVYSIAFHLQFIFFSLKFQLKCRSDQRPATGISFPIPSTWTTAKDRLTLIYNRRELEKVLHEEAKCFTESNSKIRMYNDYTIVVVNVYGLGGGRFT